MTESTTSRQAVKSISQEEDWGDSTLRNPLEFREWWKVLMRVWRPSLTPSQFMVAAFVFDRTAAWGKEWEVITVRHFVDGVTSRDGTCYAPGLGLSQPTVSAALNTLVALGLLRKRAVRHRFAYALNYEFNPQNPMKMPTPKRLAEPQKVKDSFTPNKKRGQNSFTLNCTKSIKRNVPETPQALNGPETSMEEKMHKLQILADETMKRTSSRRKVRQDAMTSLGCATMWQDACKEFHPAETHLSLTQADSAILRRFLARAFGKDATRARDFVRWLSEHWLLLRAELFHWMQNSPPAVPSIRFTVRFSDKFETAFAERDEYERLAALPLRDREVRTLMRRKGMGQAAAEAEVDAREAKTVQARQQRKDAKAATLAASALSAAQAREQQAGPARKRWDRVAAARTASSAVDLPDFDSLPD